MTVTSPSALRRLGWALLLRCPNCGGARALQHWFALRAHCPSCRFRYDRAEADSWIGGFQINLIVAEALFAALFIALFVAQWPRPDWAGLQRIAIVGVLVAPVLTWPWGKLLWLVIDLAVRPARASDLAD
jgi:uncharacterized protein (DUF983 family)